MINVLMIFIIMIVRIAMILFAVNGAYIIAKYLVMYKSVWGTRIEKFVDDYEYTVRDRLNDREDVSYSGGLFGDSVKTVTSTKAYKTKTMKVDQGKYLFEVDGKQYIVVADDEGAKQKFVYSSDPNEAVGISLAVFSLNYVYIFSIIACIIGCIAAKISTSLTVFKFIFGYGIWIIILVLVLEYIYTSKQKQN